MAKKSRTPPPPRRNVQAPKQRQTVRSPEETRRARTMVGLGALGFAAVAAAVALFMFVGGDDEASAATVQGALEDAGCTYRQVPKEPGERSTRHVTDPEKPIDEWKTDPPVIGPHYAGTAIFGQYDSPVAQVQVLHNLEHGGVYIQYGDDVPEAEVAKIREYYRENPDALILAPYPKLGDKIAFGAWTEPNAEDDSVPAAGHLAQCTKWDEDAFRTFFDKLALKGPERFRRDQLLPGM